MRELAPQFLALGRGRGEFGLDRPDLRGEFLVDAAGIRFMRANFAGGSLGFLPGGRKFPSERFGFRSERIARGGQFTFEWDTIGKVPSQPFVLFTERSELRGFLRRAGAQLPRLAPERLEFLA